MRETLRYCYILAFIVAVAIIVIPVVVSLFFISSGSGCPFDACNVIGGNAMAAPVVIDADPNLKVGVYQSEPYVSIDSTGSVSGICVDVLEEIAGKEGWSLEYIPGSWERCLSNLERGKIDILLAIAWSEEREEKYDISSETVLRTWGQIFVSNDIPIETILDLDGLTVAIMKRDIYGLQIRDMVDRFGIEPAFIELQDYSAVLEAVQSGRAAAGLVDRVMGGMHMDFYGVRASAIVISPIEVRLAFPRGSGGLVMDIIDRHIRWMIIDEESILYKSASLRLETNSGQGFSWKAIHFMLSVALPLFAVLSILLIWRIKKSRSELLIRSARIEQEMELRVGAEGKFNQIKERYSRIFDSCPVGFIIIDMEGRILEMNSTAEKYIGLAPGEGNGKTPREIPALAESLPLLMGWLKRARDTGELKSFELRISAEATRKDRTLLVSANLDRSPDRDDTIHIIATDISSRSLMEDQIMQMQKMDAVGTLAGGVAHDFNNLLTGILGYANMLKLNYRDDEEVYRSAKLIEQSAERAARLTTQLLAFARKGKHQIKEVDMHTVVGNVVSLLERTIEKNITIRTRLEAGSFAVSGDPDQLEQALMNLVLNSRDAMPGGGKLVIKTETVEIDRIYCSSHPDAQPGKFVMVSVNDTGEGISEEIKRRVFEPFFTTKGISGGTGMGLAMVYGIIRNHGGSVELYSEKDLGTSVKIYIPLDEGGSLERLGQDEKEPEKGHGRIMVVDDEVIVLKTTSDMLKNLGYEVEAFRDCQKAIDHYRDNMDSIDMVILDMIMPVIDGGELYDRLKEMNPRVKGLLSSGYILDERARDLLEKGIDGFLQKPFFLSQLSAKVSEIIGS
ncbi:MAG: transporter substrate-binding domain-containing protein [Bacteroidales bacterium]|nr:transporter substrate-binding domain-containing protein [Candidatus Latescibacterota bacterium]